MNYRKIYKNLIEKAKSRTQFLGYFEKHHIIPRCVGGSNAKENIVKLTGREHFIAHLLLRKIYPKNTGLSIAVLRMFGDRRRVNTSKKYEWVRAACHEKMSQHHSHFAKQRWQTSEYQEKISSAIKRSWQDPNRIEIASKNNIGRFNPMYGKRLSQKTKILKSQKIGAKPFKVWRAICIKPSSYKGAGIYEKGEFLGEFQLRNDFEKKFNVKRQLITKCLNGKTPQAGGFIFEFAD